MFLCTVLLVQYFKFLLPGYLQCHYTMHIVWILQDTKDSLFSKADEVKQITFNISIISKSNLIGCVGKKILEHLLKHILKFHLVHLFLRISDNASHANIFWDKSSYIYITFRQLTINPIYINWNAISTETQIIKIQICF